MIRYTVIYHDYSTTTCKKKIYDITVLSWVQRKHFCEQVKIKNPTIKNHLKEERYNSFGQQLTANCNRSDRLSFSFSFSFAFRTNRTYHDYGPLCKTCFRTQLFHPLFEFYSNLLT